MKCFLLMFYQSRDALKMVDILSNNNIQVTLIPTPETINPDCGFSLKVSPNHIENAIQICNKSHCKPHEIFLMRQIGLKLMVEDEWEYE